MSFQTKEIASNGLKRIVLQDENGPCPLLAIVNTLILLDGLSIDNKSVTAETLISQLQERTQTDLGDYKHSLLEGLDANPKFDGTFANDIQEFFGLWGIQLVHGWVIPEDFGAAREFSYDQLIDQVISDSKDTNVLMARSFIETHPTQLSPDGIKTLMNLNDGDVVVLFRNNHYSTLVKHKDLLLTLVTDQGFARYGDVIWESLDGKFYEANFQQRDDCSRDEDLARELQQQEDERGARASNNARSGGRNPNSSGSAQTKSSSTGSSKPSNSKSDKTKKKGKCIIA